MRRLILLFAAIPAVALAADTQAGRYTVPQQSRQTGVFGDAKAAAPATVTTPTAALAGSDALECRMSCAQTYYFCRAGDIQDSCAPTWSQCVAACASPALASPVSTAP
jgi:hypothetical protein